MPALYLNSSWDDELDLMSVQKKYPPLTSIDAIAFPKWFSDLFYRFLQGLLVIGLPFSPKKRVFLDPYSLEKSSYIRGSTLKSQDESLILFGDAGMDR